MATTVESILEQALELAVHPARPAIRIPMLYKVLSNGVYRLTLRVDAKAL